MEQTSPAALKAGVRQASESTGSPEGGQVVVVLTHTFEIEATFPDAVVLGEMSRALRAQVCAPFEASGAECTVQLQESSERRRLAQTRVWLAVTPVSSDAPTLGPPTIDTDELAAELGVAASSLSVSTVLDSVGTGVTISYYDEPTGANIAAAVANAEGLAAALEELYDLPPGSVVVTVPPYYIGGPAPPPAPPTPAVTENVVGIAVGASVGGVVGVILVLLLLVLLVRRQRRKESSNASKAARRMRRGRGIPSDDPEQPGGGVPPPLPPGAQYDSEASGTSECSWDSDREGEPVSRANARVRELERRIRDDALMPEQPIDAYAEDTSENLDKMAQQYTRERLTRAGTAATDDILLASSSGVMLSSGVRLIAGQQQATEAQLRDLFGEAGELEREQSRRSAADRARHLRV